MEFFYTSFGGSRAISAFTGQSVLYVLGGAFVGVACSSVQESSEESQNVSLEKTQTQDSSKFAEIPTNEWQQVKTDAYLFWDPDYYWMQTENYICSVARQAMRGQQVYWAFLYDRETNQVRGYLATGGQQYTIESYIKDESASNLYALDKKLDAFVKQSYPVPMNETQTRYPDTPCWQYTE